MCPEMKKVESHYLKLKEKIKQKQQEPTKQGWRWWSEDELPKPTGGEGRAQATGSTERACALCFPRNGNKYSRPEGEGTSHHSGVP